MRKRAGGFAGYGCAVLVAAAVLAPHHQAASAPWQYPAALAGHPFVSQVSPAAMSSARWDEPRNAPGGCPANPRQVHRNARGHAELDTTGAVGNCTSIQSPTVTATKPGMVYEADIYFSTFNGTWPTLWMYGNDQPGQGELDAVEDNYGANYLTWHYAPCNNRASSSTISTGPWQYDCKTNAPAPRTHNITAPGWYIVDIAFTTTGFSVYYNGRLFDSIKENVTTPGKDPMWLTVSEGSCAQPSFNACAKGISGKPGNVQVKYLRVFR
ncbi:MAG: hypothetical protein ACRDNS_07355 [Trebonia sp.]